MSESIQLSDVYLQQQLQYRPLTSDRSFKMQMGYCVVQISDETEIEATRIPPRFESESKHIELPIKPVYVTDRNGESILMYNSLMMREGERYLVTWNDEDLALVKEGDDVIVYKRETQE